MILAVVDRMKNLLVIIKASSATSGDPKGQIDVFSLTILDCDPARDSNCQLL